MPQPTKTFLLSQLSDAWHSYASLRENTEAFRLCNGLSHELSGLIIEVYGAYLVIYAYESWISESVESWWPELLRITGCLGALFKDRNAKAGDQREGGRDLSGNCPECIVIQEAELKFEIHLQHPHNVGLFLDTRLLRRNLYNTCVGQRVANLFAYSGSLGLAAAKGSAEHVHNVDISGTYLQWAKNNIALNGLSEEKVRCHKMDSEAFLDWAKKKVLTFDSIILDPPSFSRHEGKVYSFSKDYKRLAGKAIALLAPEGRLFALTNYAQMQESSFQQLVTEAALEQGKILQNWENHLLPEDFPITERGEHALIIAETLWMNPR